MSEIVERRFAPHATVACLLAIASSACVCGGRREPLPGGSPLETGGGAVAVRYLPRFWEDAMVAAGITGQDGAAPVPLSDGRTLWTFGDTFLQPGEQGLTNSGFVVERGEARYYADGRGKARHLLPLVAPETWAANRVWPGVAAGVGETLYLFYEVLRLDGATDGDTANIGVAKAQAGEREPGFVRAARDLPVPTITGVAQADGFVWLFSIRKNGFDSHVVLSRVAEARVEEPAAYTLVEERLINDVFGQAHVTWNEHLARWVMLHPGNPFERPRDVMIRTAPHPTGPWSGAATLFTVTGRLGEDWKGLLYVPYPHPELFRENGRVMALSFCLVGDPAAYLVEVELR